MNTVKVTTNTHSDGVPVKSLKGGELCRWSNDVYVVVAHGPSLAPTHIGAISLIHGGYITGDALVDAIPKGSIITLEVGR